MKDVRVEKVADILIEYSMDPKKDEKIAIRGPYVAEPLMLALYERCLDRGAQVMLRPTMPHAEPLFFQHAQDHQLEYVWEPDKWLSDNLDITFAILAPENTRQMTHVDGEKQQK